MQRSSGIGSLHKAKAHFRKVKIIVAVQSRGFLDISHHKTKQANNMHWSPHRKHLTELVGGAHL